MNRFTIIVLVILITVIISIGLFIRFLAYSSTKDVSQDIRFKNYLNKPLVIKQPSALIRSTESVNRFSDYYIDVSSKEAFKNDKTIVKKYNIGDTIVFTFAKGYFSNHVGDTYYLLGKEKLDSSDNIEFEYSASFKYLPAIWESQEEFLERRKAGKDFP